MNKFRLLDADGVVVESFPNASKFQAAYGIKSDHLRRILKLGKYNGYRINILEPDDVFSMLNVNVDANAVVISDGETAKVFPSASAVAKFLNVTRQAVCQVISGKRPTCGGWFIKRIGVENG